MVEKTNEERTYKTKDEWGREVETTEQHKEYNDPAKGKHKEKTVVESKPE